MSEQSSGMDAESRGVVVAEVGRRVFRGGMLSGRSSFAPDLVVWTAATAADLRARFVDQPDESSDNFMVKLRRQLEGAPDETVVLAAELLYVNLVPLVPEQIGVPKKREILREVLSWAGQEVSVPKDLDAAMTGYIHGGQAFLNYRWAQFKILVLLTERLTTMPEETRNETLSDPWRFRAVCEGVRVETGDQKARAQLHLLNWLLFPDTFMPIASIQHKKQIREAFRDRLSEVSDDVDRDLQALSAALAQETGGRVDFYSEPWLGLWRHPAREGAQRGWMVRGSNVDGHNFIPDWLAGGYCSTSWREIPEIPAGATKTVVQQTVAEALPESSAIARGQAASQLHSFLSLIKPGDVVITVTSDEVHVGTVQGEAFYDPGAGLTSARRRPVRWATAGRALRRRQLPELVQSQLNRPPTVYDISAVAAEIAEAAGLEEEVQDDLLEVDSTRPLELPSVTEELAQELLMPREWLRETVQQLEFTRQMILYGPPGTGKTFLARRLAQHLAGADRTRLVQFHPSYTYEDFFEGFRPVRGEGGTVAFEVVPGPLKVLAEQARRDPGNPYVLIIDEINRAHLAKVFGELYFLLEYRDEPITTQYSPEQPFDLPRNLFIIGTMNTADRSIALIDAAMRRRFAFRRLAPDRAPIAGLLHRWLERHQLDLEPARLLDALNQRLADPDRAIGPSYLMNHRVADPQGMELIWQTQVLPLLEDQLYGTGVDIETEYGLTALRTDTTTPEAG